LTGGEDERALVVNEARSRLHLVDPRKPHPILCSPERVRLSGDDGWLACALSTEHSPILPDDTSVLHLGSGLASAADSGHVFSPKGGNLADGFVRMLMDLWMGGSNIRWDLWLGSRGYQKLSLPTYVFSDSLSRPAAEPFPTAITQPNGSQSDISSVPELIQLWPQWLRTAYVAETYGHEQDKGPILIFEKPTGDANAREPIRTAVGLHNVCRIAPGPRYSEHLMESFTLRATEKDDYLRLFETIRSRGALPTRIIHSWSHAPSVAGAGGLGQRLEEGPYSLFLLTQALIQQQPEGQIQILYLYPHEGGVARPEFAAVEALARSVQRENPNLLLRSLALEEWLDGEGKWRHVARELRSLDKSVAVRYDADQRWVKRYQQTSTREPDKQNQACVGLRSGGVYLVVGGAGGLGLKVVEHCLKVRDVKVALAGRSARSQLSGDQHKFLDGGESQRVAYFQCDVSQPCQAHDLVKAVRERFGPLTGVVLAAGVLRDSYVLRKALADFQAVLAPKVFGAINVDEATNAEPLEFFVLFSSLAAITGNIGQADYAFANAFLDTFTLERERRVAIGARSGRTISINWPLWQDGGMRVPEQIETVFSAEMGLVAMPVAQGLAALDAALRGSAGQRILLYGHRDRACKLVEVDPSEQIELRSRPSQAERKDSAETAIRYATRYLRRIFSELLGVAEAEVDSDLGFDQYGIDSILISQFNAQIERDLGNISKTILFECRTLTEVSAYLGRRLGAELEAMFASEAPRSEIADARVSSRPVPSPDPARVGQRTNGMPAIVSDGSADDRNDVAIIGMSGRYPMAPDLDQFWRNLAEGRDCISDLPAERRDSWDTYASKPHAAHLYCKSGGFLEGLDRFDPLFFNISPRDAELMDPQERIFLQTAWHAFEDAGYPPSRLGDPKVPGNRDVGVFVGVTTLSYLMWGPDEWRKGNMVIPTSTPWAIANRISYWLDLHGPSMPVDTACASALTAVHLACESLKKGECRLALVGGVNLYLHPSKYEWMCQLRMLSKTGRCHTFGEAADGFVPGEGVGALVLKPLQRAVADCDRILAVIKGSAVNHGGRTNGFMVPSPMAQAELVKDALRSAGVDPRSISYVEAHGTGTSLGDPIEIAGLTEAFRGASAEKQMQRHCAIGSVKTNIGHLESAAGIAGLTKVLLQMKHGQLAPSLHAEPQNSRIDFHDSPFFVQRNLSEWLPSIVKDNGQEREYPRRAGISSFGAGGSNAHVIIEEYCGPRFERRGEPGGEHLVVLSAKNEDRLREYCRRLAAALRQDQNCILSELAYQLQIRREPLEERLAIVCSDVEVLTNQLAAFGEGRLNGTGFYWNNVKTTRRDGTAALPGIEGAIRSRNLPALASNWTAGMDVRWESLYTDPLRYVAIPSYPFAEERYWIPQITPADSIRPLGAKEVHPFLARSAASSEKTSFSVEFTGREFFLADHRVEQNNIFPAVAYIEMARAAMADLGNHVTRVRNSVFSFPLAVAASTRVHIDLTPNAGGADYEVYTFNGTDVRIVHCQGKIDGDRIKDSLPPSAPLELDAIRARCAKIVTANELYSRLSVLGLRLGDSYRGIREVHVGAFEVLSEIRLPEHLRDSFDSFTLHPSIMDSALQGSRLLLEQREGLDILQIPFSIGEVEIFGPTPAHVFAHVLLKVTTAGTSKLEVQLADTEGRVMVRIRDLWTRALRTVRLAADSPSEPIPGVFFSPAWVESPLAGKNSQPVQLDPLIIFGRSAAGARIIAAELASRVPSSLVQTITVTVGKEFQRVSPSEYEVNPDSAADFASLAAQTSRRTGDYNIIYTWPDGVFDPGDQSVRGQLNTGLFPILRLVQALLRSSGQRNVRLLFIFPGVEADRQPCYEALGGFFRSASRESSRLSYRIVELPSAELDALQEGRANAAAGAIADEFLGVWTEGQEVCYRGSRRLVKRWSEYRRDGKVGSPLLRREGVYLVAGGAGGLGRVVSRFLAATVAARVVLVGRSASDASIEVLSRTIRDAGGAALYLRADISRAEDVCEVVRATKAAFGSLHGIINCAGIIRDSLLVNKDESSVEEVLAPKLWGTIHLDTLTKDEPLDFIALFSSMAGVVGNIGQADYAFANSFLDSFSEWREGLRRTGYRSGMTISLDWPLWLAGGMYIDEASEEALYRSFGIRPMETSVGVAALSFALTAPSPTLLFVPGDGTKLRHILGGESSPVPAPVRNDGGNLGNQKALILRVQAKLIELIANLQKLEPKRVHPARALAEYGFDSITFTKLSNEINRHFEVETTPALFFEYLTVEAVAAALWEQYAGKIATSLSGPPLLSDQEERAGGDAPLESPSQLPINTGAAEGYGLEALSPPAAVRRGNGSAFLEGPILEVPRSFSSAVSGSVQGVEREPIAIIGMHGLLPQSEDLAEFWEHLENGRNLVTEIPSDRWDWREHFGDPLKERNKTNSKWGAFLREVDKFDARFFGISPREAALMDPQQRLFLQTAYRAIEEAGYKPSDLSRSKTGLFVGASSHDYYDLLKDGGVTIEAYTTTGTLHAILANRVSYLLNLSGPSFPIDTACSSSLVAMRAAIEAIWAGSCELAITGGVNLILAPLIYISFARAGMLSPDGCCKTFDESANGYVRGEGVGAFLLKRLSKAVQDGDHIHAVIRGSAVNHGGRVNTLTTPNPNAQSDLIVQAFEEGGVDPATIGYIEVHGTGTALGDPIEINGLKKAFRELRRRAKEPELIDGQCWIGSVKTNIGHLEPAAGVAGLFKLILAMKHGRIPPTLHLKKLNPYIQLSDSPFRIASSLQDWPRSKDANGHELPRRSGVSSFGFGGANAHVVLEEYIPAESGAGAGEEENLFVLSARSEERLRDYARILACFVEGKLAKSADGFHGVNLGRIEHELTAAAADLLGLRDQDVLADERLEDLGFDAIHLRQLWDWIGKTHGVVTNAAQEMACDSLHAIANYLFSTQAQATRRRVPKAANAGLAAEQFSLADLAYTLQLGREPMEHRISMVASSAAQVVRNFNLFASSGTCGDGVWRGEVNDTGPEGSISEEYDVSALLKGRDLQRLAECWARGTFVDWTRLPGNTHRRRLSLPTYPFAKTRFWVPNEPQPQSAAGIRKLHPLLDELAGSMSLGEGLTFRKWLTPSDRIIGEHLIHGIGVLPGVGHLEMARAALALAQEEPFRLTNVVWRQALKVEAPGREVRVRVQCTDGRLRYEIQSVEADVLTTYSQGQCEPVDPLPACIVDSPEDIRRRCPRSIDAASFYERFRSMGIEFGPYFQSIQEIWAGEGEALALVAVSEIDRGELASYKLHPSVMDAALQTIAAVTLSTGDGRVRTRLPFSLAAVNMFRPVADVRFVHVREVSQDRFDIFLIDNAGQSCVVLREVCVRAEQDYLSSFTFVPRWERAPLEGAAATRVQAVGACLIVHPSECLGLEAEIAARHQKRDIRYVVLGTENRVRGIQEWEVDAGDAGALGSCLREVGPISSVFFLGGLLAQAQPTDRDVLDTVSAQQEIGMLSLFRLVRALDSADLIQGIRSMTVLINDVQEVGGRRTANPCASGLIGLSKSLSKEYPHIHLKCLDIGVPLGAEISKQERSLLTDAILAEPRQQDGCEVALFAGHRYVKRLRSVRLEQPSRSAFRRRGVYLIIGGASGIGAQLAEHLAQTEEARLILVGRRPQSQEIDRQIEAITSKGGEAIYLQADVTDLVRMRAMVAQAKSRFGSIHGVVHGAMVLQDGLVARMTEETFRSVLAPKVAGTAILAELFTNERLDFMLFFSSAQSFSGSTGQSNYAAACTFKDGFVRALAGHVTFPVKIINWGFWGTVGSVASEVYRTKLSARGVHSITPTEGMEIIEMVLANDERQVIVVKAEEPVLIQMGVHGPAPDETAVRLESLPHLPPLELTNREEEEQVLFESYLAYALLGRLQDIGVLRCAGEVYRRQAFTGALRALPKYQRLVDAITRILARHHLVIERGGEFIAADRVGSEEAIKAVNRLTERQSEIRSSYPNLAARLNLLTACLGSLPQVLSGEVLAPEVLFPYGSVDLVANVYRGDRMAIYGIDLCAKSIAAFVKSRIQHGSVGQDIHIIEVGAGTGGTTQGVLDALRGLDGNLSYDFTDLSARFLRPAEQKLGNLLRNIKFRTFDIEGELETQGFLPETYDLVLAAGVMHATRDLDASLIHARKLLKPGGWLVLNELTRMQDFYTVTFGLLDGWWHHEDEARRLETSPILDVEMWRYRLTDAGFRRIVFLGEGSDGRELPQRVIVAEASPQTQIKAAPASMAAAHLPRSAARRELYPLTSTAGPSGGAGAMKIPGPAGVEIAHDKPRHGVTGEELTTSMVSSSGTSSRKSARPHAIADSSGDNDSRQLGARVQKEIIECMCVCLGMEPAEVDRKRAFSSQGVDSIVGVEIINKLNDKLGVVLKTIVIFDYPDVEQLAAFIVERHGRQLSGDESVPAKAKMAPPSTTEAREPDAAFVSAPVVYGGERELRFAPVTPASSPHLIPIIPSNPSGSIERPETVVGGFQAVRFERPGSPKDLRVVPIEPVEPGAGEVEVLVRAFPINFSDFLLAKGLYPMMPDFPFTPGVEVAGVIGRVGPGVDRVAVGDEVIALMRPEMGGQASVVVTDAEFVVRKPKNVSFEDACGFPAAFIAMYLAFERAAVKRGERVLIQGATGSNGLIAVQLAQLAGAEIFATAGSPKKADFLTRMGVAHAINYREVDFAEEVLRCTDDEGVDIIIDVVGGEALKKGLSILAPDGRYVDLAVFGLQMSKEVDLSKLINNQIFYSINAKKFFVKRPQERARYLDLMASYLESGKVKPITAVAFPFERVMEAYEAKENRENIGRIVVTLAACTAIAAPVPVHAPNTGHPPAMDIAIVGMSGRFPGAENLGQLWENLSHGISAVRDVPSSRWANSLYFDPDRTRMDRTYCKSGGFLDDVDKFDAAFFSMSGKEADLTDPQHRLFLEESFRALEDAGYCGSTLNGKCCGVFVGAGVSDYLTRMNKADVIKEAQAFWGNDCSVLASRISYFLNLKGPVITVNTACSSSLVALHLACQSILNGESEFAIAGGVFLAMAPDYFIVATNGNMMSADGRCKTFDDSADGFGPGEGVGAVVLKPLSRALEDGNHIWGVIKGSAINQDGKTNGITAPSSLAQSDVELAAYRRAGISPETISYVEAHGTGTKLGDPIEVEALTNAFRNYTARTQFCAIGSIKTNIGHAANAAGIAGLIKILLSFKYRQIPASLNFVQPNIHIDFKSTPFFVNTRLRDWQTEDGIPRRAALSSFGFSGTNAHVVLEEAPAYAPSTLPPRSAHLIPLSAASSHALQTKIEHLLRWLEGEGSGFPLAEIAYNLQVFRDHFPLRVALFARDTEELRRKLRARSANAGPDACDSADAPDCLQLTGLAARYLAGERIDWEETLYPDSRGLHISMPTYPFDRERHWYAEIDTAYADPRPGIHAGIELRSLAQDINPRVRRFQITLTGREFFLEGHLVNGKKVLPGALYLEFAYKAAQAAGYSVGTLRNMCWLRPVVVDGTPVDLEVILRLENLGLQIEIRSGANGEADVLHAKCGVQFARSGRDTKRIELAEIRRSCPRIINRAEHYEKLRTAGLVHGKELGSVDEIWTGRGMALARLTLPEASDTLSSFSLHPSLIDGALQLAAAFEDREDIASHKRLLPFSIEEVTLLKEMPAECFAYAVAIPGTSSNSKRSYHIELLDNEGFAVVSLRNFSIKAADGNGAPPPHAHSELLAVLRQLQAGEIGEQEAASRMEVIDVR